MTLKRIFLVMMLCLLAIVGLPGGMPKMALACGGEYKTFLENYKNSDIFVKAIVVEPDDFGQNAIVKVERYYKGGAGAEYILFWRLSVSEMMRFARGNYSCGGLLQSVQKGDTVYFMATHTDVGNYKSWYQSGLQYFIFSRAGDKANVIKSNTGNPSADIEALTEQEFERYFKGTIGATFDTPNRDLPHPRYAPLLVTTSDQKRYLLPIDSDKLVDETKYQEQYSSTSDVYNGLYLDSFGRGTERCFGFNCVAISPDKTRRLPSGMVTGDCSPPITYQAALFSPFRSFALWSEGKIYLGCKQQVIATLNTDSKHSADALAIYAQWNADGSKFVYNDLKGLWLWEQGRRANNPRLLIPIENSIASARYFSPRGTHLAISHGERRYTLNLETGHTFFDGLFSPTEEYFLAFGTTNPQTGAFPVLVCQNAVIASDSPLCKTDTFKQQNDDDYSPDEVSPDSPLGSIRQIQWIGEYSLLALTYPRQRNAPVEVYWDARQGYVLRDLQLFGDGSFHYPVYWADKQADGTFQKSKTYISGFEFVYDHGNKSLALRQNDTSIFIDDKSYDFSKQLSSPIVQMDWLPSLMYRDRAH